MPAYLPQTDTNSPHPKAQSDPDSQTDRPLARNSASGCNAARSLHHNTGFAGGRVDAHACKPTHPFSDDLTVWLDLELTIRLQIRQI